MDDWEAHRRYLFAVAYRLLGSAADAEDAVQEAFLRLRDAAPADLVSTRAWLTTVTSRICLDMLGSARARRESYVGTWLPEPLADYDDADLGDTVALRESVRTAVLLVLETLSPAERVAFVLHDAFGMDFDRVAAVVGRTPAACRQLASRARRRVRADAPPRNPVSAEDQQRVLAAFVAASADGDLTELVNLLDPTVVLRSDGGGAVPAARKPVHGRDRVLRLLAGLARRYPGVRSKPVLLAGGGGFVLEQGDTLLGVVGVEVDNGRVTELNLVVNPAKLGQLTYPRARPAQSQEAISANPAPPMAKKAQRGNSSDTGADAQPSDE
jgi:RNA polymerase sigma-70 factor (ECF subfamily)